MHYYPFNLKDYLVQTAHLPPLADLAYRRLIDLYYLEETPIPNKPKWVANRIRMDSDEAIIGFVLREYFTLDKTAEVHVWRHERCDKVIAKYQKKAAIARENGLQHVAGTKKEPKSDADGLLTKNHKPRTKNRNTPLPPTGEMGEGFVRWYDAYPLKVAKQDALKAWMQLLPDAALMRVICDAIGRQVLARHFENLEGISNPPYPATWLRARRWEDEIKPARLHATQDAGQQSVTISVAGAQTLRNAAAAEDRIFGTRDIE